MMCTLFNVSLDDLVKGDVKRMGHEEVKKTWILDVDDVDLDFISLCFNRTTFILFELVGRCDYLCYFSVGFIVVRKSTKLNIGTVWIITSNRCIYEWSRSKRSSDE